MKTTSIWRQPKYEDDLELKKTWFKRPYPARAYTTLVVLVSKYSHSTCVRITRKRVYIRFIFCARIYNSSAHMCAPIFNCCLMSLTLKFHKNPSFRGGDVQLFVTFYNCHNPTSTSTQLKSWAWHENDFRPPTTTTNSMSSISQLYLTRF